MPEFKNCKAECWMFINTVSGVYGFANTYNGNLKASYNPDHYSYPLNEKTQKKVTKKQEEFEEVDVTDWPSFLSNAKRRAKATK